MTPKEAADKLNGGQYGKEGSKELWSAMKAAGLVAVFSASDDLMEFRGAIDDEVGAYDGGTAYVTPEGLLTNDCENDDCPHFKKRQDVTAIVEAIWAPPGGLSWRIDSKIPHAEFTIFEDEDKFCEGIVFALADVPAA